ncbi:hypothetical protein [Chitinibacter tainanensis]|uniref:hypothetical protein n=1 Tax=Chitinibacter tainanensis TaxID=230667 RepID=UPI00235504C6|nr:hypothetical protein [Chitinibacter tainanensis]
MGYTFTIGELEVIKSEGDGLDCPCISFGAKGISLKGSPAFGEPTDSTNERWPSYCAWSDFLKDVELYDVFYSDNHLIGGHPGIRLVTKDLQKIVSQRLIDFKTKHPELKPIFDEENKHAGSLCRLIWLDYWIEWALINCETPVIANT